MTYYGHSVLRTLIRCRFSPPDNTGQRYICTGDSTGRFISKYPSVLRSASLIVSSHDSVHRVKCTYKAPLYIAYMFPFSSFVVYDLLTGKLVRKIKGHTDCVRDVSWHPLDYNLITSSVSKIIKITVRMCLVHCDWRTCIISIKYKGINIKLSFVLSGMVK